MYIQMLVAFSVCIILDVEKLFSRTTIEIMKNVTQENAKEGYAAG